MKYCRHCHLVHENDINRCPTCNRLILPVPKSNKRLFAITRKIVKDCKDKNDECERIDHKVPGYTHDQRHCSNCTLRIKDVYHFLAKIVDSQ